MSGIIIVNVIKRSAALVVSQNEVATEALRRLVANHMIEFSNTGFRASPPDVDNKILSAMGFFRTGKGDYIGESFPKQMVFKCDFNANTNYKGLKVFFTNH